MSSQDMVLFDSSAGISQKFLPIAADIAGDLSEGVGGGFAVLSIKGSRWRVKYQGQENPITDEKGDPVASIEAVIIKANDVLTKQYYASGFTEGDNSAPVCFSLDGRVPAEGVQVKQHDNCMTCPKNVFGSKVNADTGKKSKACQDNRKLAVVPLADLKNELFGGPMLLRIPASALKDLAMFGDTLKARGYPYNSVAVRIGFDLSVSYPKPVFRAIRPLSDDEAEQVLEWYGSDAVQKILADFDADIAPAAAVPAQDSVFEQAPAAAAPAPTPPPPPLAPKAAPKAATPPPAPAAAPKPAGVAFGKPAAAAAPAAAPAAPKTRKAAAPPPPPVATPAAVTEPEAVPEVVAGNLEDDISQILADLNGVAGAE